MHVSTNSISTMSSSPAAAAAVRLDWADYVVLAAFLAVSLAIGVYHSLSGGRQRSTDEFIMANRRLSVVPTALSMFVSFQSAISVLGLTAEMYLYGSQLLVWVPVSYAAAYCVAERLVVPWLYPLRLVSVNAVSRTGTVPIQLAQCRFPGLAISSAEI